MDVEVRVGDVVPAAFLLEAQLDGFHLPGAAGFAVHAFHVHAAGFDLLDAARDDGGDEAFFVFAACFEVGAEEDC